MGLIMATSAEMVERRRMHLGTATTRLEKARAAEVQDAPGGAAANISPASAGG
jgi:hypothetical protein